MFKIAKRTIADVEPIIHNLEGTSGETIELGEVLKLASGKLTKAGATDKPTHLCVGVADSNGMIPCIKLHPGIYLATDATATVAATLIGSAVTLHTDGASCTATTTSGVFTIDETDGDKSVIGHFA